eukprot:Hpha_TRINITY_DN13557_c0_g1::TRINITY_DN13557_c0_g1_i1::g.111439::m.111439
MACGISGGLSARCRERLRMQMGGSDAEIESSPSFGDSFSSPARLSRTQTTHQPTLQTVPIGDPHAAFMGAPKWPRPRCWRVVNSPRDVERPRLASTHDIGTPLGQEPDAPLPPLMSQEEDALCGSGPLSMLNSSRPKRYGITHPGRYGQQDREGLWKQTMLETSMGYEKKLRQRMDQLRFPSLEMVQPMRRAPPRKGSLAAARRRERGDKRNVVLPRTIRSNMVVDARGRRMFTELPIAES